MVVITDKELDIVKSIIDDWFASWQGYHDTSIEDVMSLSNSLVVLYTDKGIPI